MAALVQRLSRGAALHRAVGTSSRWVRSGHQCASSRHTASSSSVRWSSQQSASTRRATDTLRPDDAEPGHPPPPPRPAAPHYHGPLAQTFRRLKIFSLASLGLTFTMAPFLFVVESSLPLSARIFLTATAISTSGISTALVGWCGAPYVVDLRRLTPEENEGMEGVEMTTLTLTLNKLTTRVYDSDFLVETGRPFAKWELPLAVQLPPANSQDATTTATEKAGVPGEEETVAETLNDKGEVIGRWIVKWGEGGAGSCRGAGRVLRYFNVHEELL